MICRRSSSSALNFPATRASCRAMHVVESPGRCRCSRAAFRDLANRSLDINWPKGFTRAEAELFSHNELFINASCERVWRHIVEATKWSDWYPNSKNVQILGGRDSVLKSDSVFRWTTFSLPLESRINEFVPYSRIGWFGYAPGTEPSFYHTWYLAPQGNGCRVVTDEVGRGKALLISARPMRGRCTEATICGWLLSSGSPKASKSLARERSCKGARALAR
jgi:hypothetical protein